MTENTKTAEGQRRGGRPIKGDGPAVREDELDRLLVHGEAGENGIVKYPSYRELAARFGVAHSVIADYATRHNCRRRRKDTEEQVRVLVAQRLIEQRVDKTTYEKDAMLDMLGSYFQAFGEALKEGRVRTDNIADFDKACRLQAFLMGDSESRKEVVNGITLEYLQERHREYLEQLANTTPEMTGAVVRQVERRPDDDCEIVDAEIVEDDDSPGT